MSFKQLSFDKDGAPMLDGERVPNVISYEVGANFGKTRNSLSVLTLTLYVKPPKKESQENG